MTLNTDPSQSDVGGIYADRKGPNRIEVGWRKDASVFKLNLQLFNADHQSTIITSAVVKSKKYKVDLIFDGNNCEWYVDGIKVGSPIDCSSGFGGLGKPKLCYTGSGGWGGWTGMITNLAFAQNDVMQENINGNVILFDN